MSFTDDLNAINHAISRDTAVEMVNRYNANQQNLLSGGFFSNPNVLLDYETFNLAAINNIILQTGCVGFRIYMGMDTSNYIRSILVGVDINGQDIIMNGACTLTVIDEIGQRHP
jgi:hypothetical protein